MSPLASVAGGLGVPSCSAYPVAQSCTGAEVALGVDEPVCLSAAEDAGLGVVGVQVVGAVHGVPAHAAGGSVYVGGE